MGEDGAWDAVFNRVAPIKGCLGQPTEGAAVNLAVFRRVEPLQVLLEYVRVAHCGGTALPPAV